MAGCPAVLYHQQRSPACDSILSEHLPVPAGSPSSGATPTEASKSAAIAVTAASATIATAATPHQISQEKEDQTDIAGFCEKKDDEENDRAANDNLEGRDLNRLRLGRHAVILVSRGSGQGDACILGDNICDLTDSDRNRGVVVVLACSRSHGTAYVTHLCVIEDAFEAVSHLDAPATRIHNEDHQDAAILFIPHLPFVFKVGRELLDALVVIEGLDGDHGNLRVGLMVNLCAQGLKILLYIGTKDSSEVVNVPGWCWKRVDRLGRGYGRCGNKYKDEAQPSPNDLHQRSFYAGGDSGNSAVPASYDSLGRGASLFAALARSGDSLAACDFVDHHHVFVDDDCSVRDCLFDGGIGGAIRLSAKLS